MILGCMDYSFDSRTLQLVWSALQEKVSPVNLHLAVRIAKRIVEKGWAFESDMEDLLYHLDRRIWACQFDVVEFSKMLGIHWESVCFRPTARSRSVLEFYGIRPEDAALLLILLERIGFQVDPTILVGLLLPKVKTRTKEIFNNSELEIFWFGKTRHKYGSIILKTRDGLEAEVIDTFNTASKYKIVVKGRHNKPESILISSPKFRRQGDPLPVTCAECGLQWYKGDSDSSANHRKEHKRRMHYLEPKPSKQMLEDRQIVDDPELVKTTSATWKHKEMYIRAVAFKREFGYDFVQWQSEKGDKDPYVQGFLFTDEPGAIVGACSFRRDDKMDNNDFWVLDWVWICPKERRKGHLAKRWERLRKRFGNFRLTFPVSDDMKTFLAKHRDSSLLDE